MPTPTQTPSQKAIESNYLLFRDCLSTPLIEKSRNLDSSTRKKEKKVAKNRQGRKSAIKPVLQSTESKEEDDASELAEFIDYLATEIFTSLPEELRSLTYSTWINTPSLQSTYTSPPSPPTLTLLLNTIPVSVTDTLSTYLSSPSLSPENIITAALTSYATSILTPPPPPSLTKDKADGCELCERDWIPLTYHHLIPKSTHERVLKRGWHTEDQLGNVAWLCRACHSFVHRIASNEELAKDWYTIEKLVEREDVIAFTKWVGGVRWKAR